MSPFTHDFVDAGAVTSNYYVFMKDIMKCYSCGTYFKHHAFNRTNECDDCLDSLVSEDSDANLEINILVNKSGKTQAIIEDERDMDIDSFSS